MDSLTKMPSAVADVASESDHDGNGSRMDHEELLSRKKKRPRIERGLET